MPSPNVALVTGSATLSVNAAVQRRRGQGAAVLDLGIGEPMLDSDPLLVAAAVAAVREGRTRYTAVEGIPALRAAIAEWTSRADGCEVSPEETIVTVGSKQALFDACFVLFGPGDEVLVPQPAWPSYAEMIRLARATPVPVLGGAERDFKPSADELEARATSRTRGIILNSPCNPTGAVYTAAELRALLDLAARREWWVIADEIYRHVVYDARPAASVLQEAADRTRVVVVGGVAKALVMTGWRLGWAVAPPAVVRAMSALQSHTTSNAPTVAQHAALAAFAEPETFGQLAARTVDLLRPRRDAALRALTAVGARFVDPRGAFYLWVACGGDDAAFASELLDKRGVAVVPGYAFGVPGWVRASYAGAEADVGEGFARVAQALVERRQSAAAPA
ncbi:MAG TPA: aminotransferase class I/II-fold pyridoxal phosphate-dependent enzyme [Gemmatimonadaceae bacterium]|nr:aminotransferase class I/II-fold pyridoxal phosphate-dependent enzyme [Gemmatimonadaceae bacterium]